MGWRLRVMEVIGMVSVAAGCLERRPESSQPIAFDHRQHVHDYQMGCSYCHVLAEHADQAGMPSVASCWGCHRFVAADKPGSQRLAESSNTGTSIVWARLQQLPDHTRFSHQVHLAAGMACQSCHGQVQEMHRLRVVQSFVMNWCVDCHRQRQGSTDCVACHR